MVRVPLSLQMPCKPRSLPGVSSRDKRRVTLAEARLSDMEGASFKWTFPFPTGSHSRCPGGESKHRGLRNASEPRTQRSGVSGLLVQPLTPLRCVPGSEINLLTVAVVWYECRRHRAFARIAAA